MHFLSESVKCPSQVKYRLSLVVMDRVCNFREINFTKFSWNCFHGKKYDDFTRNLGFSIFGMYLESFFFSFSIYIFFCHIWSFFLISFWKIITYAKNLTTKWRIFLLNLLFKLISLHGTSKNRDLGFGYAIDLSLVVFGSNLFILIGKGLRERVNW